MKYSIGIDLGGTDIKAGLVAADGTLMCRSRFSTRVNEGPHAVAARIAKIIRQIITEAGGEEIQDKLTGIGLGAPGLVIPEEGIVHFSPNFPGWHEIPLVAYLSSALPDLDGVPLSIDNDVNVMALGELHHGAGRGYENLITLTLGTGVGGGIVINKQVYHGNRHAAGEFGHVIVEPVGRQCGCGNQGCLEAYAGAQHIVARTLQEITEKNRKTALNSENLTPKQIAEAAAAGDELARDIFAETGRYIGVALTSIAHILNPQIAIIGGGIADAGEDLLFQHIRAEFKSRAIDIPGTMEIVPAQLGTDAGFVGAAMLAQFN